MGNPNKKSKKGNRNVATSDSERAKGNSALFKAMLKNTRDPGSKLTVLSVAIRLLCSDSFQSAEYILLKYKDGFYQVRPPLEQNEEFMTERHSCSDELIEKQEFEKGIHIRAKWDERYQISKAIIVEVESDVEKINALFDTLEGIRQSEVRRNKNAPAKRSSRMVNTERAESDRNKRRELNNRRLFKSTDCRKRQHRTEDGEDEESDSDTAPGPIVKSAVQYKPKISFRKSTKRSRSSSASSVVGSRSSNAPSNAAKDRHNKSDIDRDRSHSKSAEFGEVENEDEWSENDWTREPEGKSTPRAKMSDTAQTPNWTQRKIVVGRRRGSLVNSILGVGK
ncbi:hypothetical protein RvY_00157 [Ramazzottius varieornatus]|uniref:Uncharacterized protein n=1 Tax=Ramazzottius varieornatus TaxID=947166 RepID=A0A1D1UMA6_RAMVA|nr:hypothetical protein RvY_00157 [Ramazzottius varieornatus]